MKTNVIMKIAIVFMAAFGAYAFSGSNANNLDSFSILDGQNCTNILAGCSDTVEGPICKIIFEGEPLTVYETGCMREIKHDNESPVQWSF